MIERSEATTAISGMAVYQFPEEHRDQIELFFLPPYSPKYNPDGLSDTITMALQTKKQSLSLPGFPHRIPLCAFV